MIDISKLLIEIVNSLYSPQTVTTKQGERTSTMLWFNNRRKVEALYYEWIQKNGVADTPMSLIAFMQIKGWLNEEKILEEISKPAEYAHGMMTDEEFKQAVINEEWLDRVRGESGHDDEEEDEEEWDR